MKNQFLVVIIIFLILIGICIYDIIKIDYSYFVILFPLLFMEYKVIITYLKFKKGKI